ncbi:MAG: hypothetical protein ACRDQ2_01945 [Gaiellales bacterium]
MTNRATRFDQDLLTRIRRVIGPGDVIYTLSIGQPNHVDSVEPKGVWVETDRSKKAETGPQLVPAWMIETAWTHLVRHGTLTNEELLNSRALNVKRSSFVCALLARFPDVEVVSRRPITLRLMRQSRG